MELRVAKALCEEQGFDWDKQKSFLTSASGGDNEQLFYISQARAAIRAMREPTFVMIDEGATCLINSEEICMNPDDVWSAMIDAASPPTIADLTVRALSDSLNETKWRIEERLANGEKL
jgi:hypothetical protein